MVTTAPAAKIAQNHSQKFGARDNIDPASFVYSPFRDSVLACRQHLQHPDCGYSPVGP
jgi:hypothetical protein